MDKWFQTWDRPEYKEWAKEIKEGYLLVIIRKELKDYLCVKANLIMGKSGLPSFEVIEEHRFQNKQKALEKLTRWKR